MSYSSEYNKGVEPGRRRERCRYGEGSYNVTEGVHIPEAGCALETNKTETLLCTR